MGQKGSKKAKSKVPEMDPELLDKYIRSEFRAMDTDHDGKLSRQEVLDILIILGYSKGKEKLKALHVKSEDSVELEDYVTAFKADKSLVSKTQGFRQLFQMFDKNKDGSVSKDELVAGLEESVETLSSLTLFEGRVPLKSVLVGMDIKVDTDMKKTIQTMDANDDGKITYEEFLTVEFKIALHKEEKKKDDAEAKAE